MFTSPLERVKKLFEEKARVEARLDSNVPISMKELNETQKRLREIEEEIKKLESFHNVF